MGLTRSKLISDVELRLTKGKVSDDFEISRRQIGFWVDEVRDEVVAAYLNPFVKYGRPLDPMYIIKEQCKATSSDGPSCFTTDDEYFKIGKITLSKTPLSLIDDGAIVLVTNKVGKVIHRIFHEHIYTIHYIKRGAPAQNRLVYLREDNDLYIFGLDANKKANTNINVSYIPSIRDMGLNDDDDYPLGDNLAPQVLDRVTEIAFNELYYGIEDTINDGAQTKMGQTTK